jgi:hypothetical protein
MAKKKESYLKEPGDTHVASRPRDKKGNPLKGVHYLKRENLAPRFAKSVSVHEADPPIEVDPKVATTNVDTSIPENPASV